MGAEDAPDYLRAGTAFPWPGRTDVFVGSLGLPVEDLHLFNVDDVDPTFFEQAKRFGEKLVSRMSPVLRVPLEIASGRTSFSRKPLKDIPKKEVLTSLLPVSRFFRTATKIIDPETPYAFRFLDALTGFRTYPVSITRAQLDELKRAAVSSGKFRREGFLTIPKAEFKEDEQAKRMLKKMQKLSKKLRREKNARQ